MLLDLVLLFAVAAPIEKYVGGSWIDRSYFPVEYAVTDSGPRLTLPMEGVTDMRPAATEGGRARFDVGRLSFVFPAERTADMTGRLTFNDRTYDVQLRRIANVTVARLEDLTGTYRTGDGRWLYVSGHRTNGVVITNESSGRTGALWPENDSLFTGGPGRFVPMPTHVRAVFGRAGGRNRITVWEDSAPPVTATEVVMNSVGEVSIPSQGATLAGSMYVPTSINGKASGIVLVHGSDPNDRFRGVIPSFYARQGYVVLTFDKRGNGGSTGSFGTATLDTLADDVAAAVRFLAADPRVDASRIGLWGISQGGWVVPLAIQRGVRAAFVILHSGATLSPMEQGHDELRGMLRARQLSEDEIARAVAYQRLYNNTVVNPALAPALDSLYAAERTRGATWLWSPQSVAANRSRIWARMLDYDPAPALRTLKMPVLALFGAMDHLVPPERHVAPLLTALREIGNNDVTVAVFPHGNHRLEVATPGVLQDWMIASRIVPGYFSTIEEWLERQHHKPRQ